jgi:transglutaminase-like putative cysteine protease
MRISIRHEIIQTFSPPARSAIQMLRLRPRDCDSQHIAAWNVDVDIDCRMKEGEDAFGNLVQTLDAEGPLSKLTIVARGEIDTFDTAGVLHGEPERFSTDVFLRDTDLTTPDPDLREFARATVKGAKSALDRPHFLMRTLHERLTFEENIAPATRTAAEAFKLEKVDSRDVAHIFIAAARTVGVPARFVSGYLAPEKDAEAATTQALHAWAEAYVEGLGWIGFDPTICLCMYDGHVRLACGLDYLGAAPLRVSPLHGDTRTISITVTAGQAQSQRQG